MACRYRKKVDPLVADDTVQLQFELDGTQGHAGFGGLDGVGNDPVHDRNGVRQMALMLTPALGTQSFNVQPDFGLAQEKAGALLGSIGRVTRPPHRLGPTGTRCVMLAEQLAPVEE